jgi:hypothetical protein
MIDVILPETLPTNVLTICPIGPKEGGEGGDSNITNAKFITEPQ